jgi:hypothetical protein
VAEFRLVLNESGISALLRSPTGPVWQELLSKGREVERYAQQSGSRSQPSRRGSQAWSYTPGRAPRDTGQMANSIRTDMAVEGTNVVAIVSAKTRYSIYVHEGTRRGLKPRPFLKDALDAVMRQSIGGPSFG